MNMILATPNGQTIDLKDIPDLLAENARLRTEREALRDDLKLAVQVNEKILGARDGREKELWDEINKLRADNTRLFEANKSLTAHAAECGEERDRAISKGEGYLEALRAIRDFIDEETVDAGEEADEDDAHDPADMMGFPTEADEPCDCLGCTDGVTSADESNPFDLPPEAASAIFAALVHTLVNASKND